MHSFIEFRCNLKYTSLVVSFYGWLAFLLLSYVITYMYTSKYVCLIPLYFLGSYCGMRLGVS